jgi:uncharacterized lipoprotein YddW (UPF0748 family)
MKIFRIVILLFIVSFVSLNAQNLSNPETRGVWITGNYLQGGSDAIESMIKGLSDANFNTIFIDVWYSGSTIYPSSVVSSAGGPKQNSVFIGKDPLRTTIDIAHKYGIEVFAWFEYGFSVGYSSDSTDVPEILKLHPDWSMTQRDTSKHFDSEDVYFFWVDPAVSAASKFMVDLYTECAKNYPDIDGIELDRMRYPAVNYSYSDSSRKKFMLETSNPDPLTLPNNNIAWASWRRLQVTNVVKDIYQSVKKVNPECIVTGAVVPPYMMYGASDDKLQAWDVWAKNSYMDILEPMLYLLVSDFPNQSYLCKGYIPSGFKLESGIAISSAGSVANTITEIKDARAAGFAGQVIWYYGDLLSYPNAMSSLKSFYQYKTVPDFDDLIIDNSTSNVFTAAGSWSSNRGGYNGTYQKADAINGNTAIFKARVLRSGQYLLYGYWTGDSTSNSSKVLIEVSSNTIHEIDTVNQTLGVNTWNFVSKYNINSGDTVTIKLYGTGGGSIIADAFRLKRGSIFDIIDTAIPDSQTVLIKFSNPLLSPVSALTKITSSDLNGSLSFFIDQVDNTVLHVTIPALSKGATFKLNIEGLVDVIYDTLNVSTNITYNPDSTEFILDNQNQNSFWKLAGNWVSDTSFTANGGFFYQAKQTTSFSRVEWGPQKIYLDGYYDVSVKIPKTKVSMSEKCLYIIKDHFSTDSIYVSQNANSGTITKLGTFPFKSNDQFAVLLTSVAGADTNSYLTADAVILKRAVEIVSSVMNNKINKPVSFVICQNYPNPFNPSTTINFSIPGDAKVSIVIYNILGEKVRELLNAKQFNMGNWNVRFDGLSLSSGIYFAMVKVKGKNFEGQKVLKMLLLK